MAIQHATDSTFKGMVQSLDDNPATSSQYQIMSIPTTLFFKDGKLLYKESGILPKHVLKQRTAYN
jgi:thioredoxin 1